MRYFSGLIVVGLLLLASTTGAASGFINAILNTDISLGVGMGPTVTAPANTLAFTQFSLHDQPIALSHPIGRSLTIRYPMTKSKWSTMGFQYSNQVVSPNEGLKSLSLGVFARTDIGPLQPSAYVAATIYSHKRLLPIGLTYAGIAAPVLTWGLGLRYRLTDSWGLQLTYEKNSDAFVYNHKYTIGTREVRLDDYVEPVVYVHASTNVYVGCSFKFNFNLLPSTQELIYSVGAAKTDAQQRLLTHVVDKNVPAAYRPFVEKMVLSLSEQLGANTFSIGKSGVYWDKNKQLLLFRLRLPQGDARTSFYNNFDESQPDVSKPVSVPGIPAGVMRDAVSVVAQTAGDLIATGMKYPANMGVVVEYESYVLTTVSDVLTDTERQYHASMARLVAGRADSTGTTGSIDVRTSDEATYRFKQTAFTDDVRTWVAKF